MSLGTHEYGDAKRRQAQYNAALYGGAKGGLLGASVAVPTAYILHQRWAPFKHLTLPLKAFFVTSATVAAAVIAADKSGIAFDHEHYTDEGAKKMRQFRSKEDKDWSELSARDKGLTYAKENKFAIVAGSWVASMGGIFFYIHKQPMPFSQKLVQTRVWAQGLTLASLVGMAFITQIPSAGDKILQEREHAADHSWRDFVGDSSADPAKGRSARDENGQRKPTKSLQTSKKQQGSSATEDNHSDKSSQNKSPEDSLSANERDSSGKSSRSASPTA